MQAIADSEIAPRKAESADGADESMKRAEELANAAGSQQKFAEEEYSGSQQTLQFATVTIGVYLIPTIWWTFIASHAPR